MEADADAKAAGMNCVTIFQNSGQPDGLGYILVGRYLLNQIAFLFNIREGTLMAQINSEAAADTTVFYTGALSGLSLAFAAVATTVLAF